jgi:hypothetical protein
MKVIDMISVIISTKRNHLIENIMNNYLHQSLKEKELIIILNKDDIDIGVWRERCCAYPNISIYQLPEKITLGECLQFSAEQAIYPYIAKFDDDDFYSSNYLTETLKTFKNSRAQVVGKGAIYIFFKEDNALGIFNQQLENKYLIHQEFLVGATLAFKKEVLQQVQFPKVNIGEDIGFQRICKMKKLPIFSSSRFNYAYLRYQESNHYHASKVSNETLRRKCKNIEITTDFEEIISKKI